MSSREQFVGRRAELARWKQLLETAEGQAILVVGQAGMGKTMLVNRMAHIATAHPTLQCGHVRYEIAPTDAPDGTMKLMMDHAFDAANVSAGSFDPTDQRMRQWRSLLGTLKLLPGLGSSAEAMAGLAASLKRDPERDARDQFLDRLRLISKRMPENGRALFVLDPDKHLPDKSADAWRLIVRALPHKIKLLFAQRPEDQLASNNDFLALQNVVRIPDKPLDALDENAVNDLVEMHAFEGVGTVQVLQDVAKRYNGHPYAVPAAFNLMRAGTAAQDLPMDPTPEAIPEVQWMTVCRHGEDAVRLFETYTVLEVAVPYDIVEAIAELTPVSRKSLVADSYLSGLMRREGKGHRIYHSLLSDYIMSQVESDGLNYHQRAVAVFRDRLTNVGEPDILAAERLPLHVLAAEGAVPFARCFVSECAPILRDSGSFDLHTVLARQAISDIWAMFEDTRSTEIRNFLIEQYSDLAVHTSQQMYRCIHPRRDLDLGDVMSAGFFGLVSAFDAFDRRDSVSFETFAERRIRKAIFNELKRMEWVPARVRSQAADVAIVRALLRDALDRDPIDADIRAVLGLSSKAYRRLMRDFATANLRSLDEEAGVSDTLSDPRQVDPSSRLIDEESWRLIMSVMSPDEHLIYALRYTADMTTTKIAATLKLSIGQVKRIHTSLLSRVRAVLKHRSEE